MRWRFKDNLTGSVPNRKTELEIIKEENTVSFNFACSKSDLISYSNIDNDKLYLASVVEVFLDVGEKRYYEIEVAPNGATFFAKILNRNIEFIDNDLFESSVHIEGAKYFVTIKVDLSKIRDFNLVKFNACRIEKDKEGNTSLYALFPTNCETFHVPEKFIKLSSFLSSEKLFEVCNRFDLGGSIINVYPYGNGHINKTYLVSTDNKRKYVLQQINNTIFPDIDALMNNIVSITKHLQSKNMETLNVIDYKDGKPYLLFDNKYYRVYDAILGAISYEEVSDSLMLEKLGYSIGEFHQALRDFDATKLVEIIPNFHNTRQRYLNLLDAIEEDSFDRKKDVLSEIEKVQKYQDQYGKIVDSIKNGKIKLAITHNDTKINNVMFDIETGQPRCVIDFDTVMPGSYLYDIGDAFRGLFTGDNEDNPDLSKINISYPIFESFMRGYLKQMKNVLNPYEIEMIPFSMFVITMECGIRFLEDYLRGDVYFRCHYPKQNINRCRTQIKLAEDIYSNMDKFHEIVERILQENK